MSELEDGINRIKGIVQAYAITGSDGKATRGNLSKEEERKFTPYVNELVDKARNVVRDVDPANDMSFLRFTMKNHEILVAPGDNFRIIALQELNKDREDARS